MRIFLVDFIGVRNILGAMQMTVSVTVRRRCKMLVYSFVLYGDAGFSDQWNS